MLKEILFVVMLITCFNGCFSQQSEALGISQQKEINSKVINDTLVVSKSQHKVITSDEYTLYLELLDAKLIDQISEVVNPVLRIELDGDFVTAKGNHIANSSVPQECEYFYPANKDGKILLKENKIIWLGKIIQTK